MSIKLPATISEALAETQLTLARAQHRLERLLVERRFHRAVLRDGGIERSGAEKGRRDEGAVARALAQAEAEYRDFILLYPDMKEAAELQVGEPLRTIRAQKATPPR